MGRTKLSQLSVPAVRAFQERLRSGDASLPDDDQTRAPRSAVMVKRVTVSLGSIIADAQERGLVSHNAVREMTKRRGKGKARQGERRRKAKLQVEVGIPTPAEMSAILAHSDGRWRPFLITAVFTGLRASELRRLRWSDIDLKSGRIHVRQRADRYHEIGMPKSDAGQRKVPIGAMVINTLKEWKLSCPKGELDLVFPTGTGQIEWHPNIVRRGLWPPQVSAGVIQKVNETGKPMVDEDGKPVMVPKHTGLHALRHFYASWCINRVQDGGIGLPPKMVQERLGHSSITMTPDTYGHLFPSVEDAEALAAAERRLLTPATAT